MSFSVCNIKMSDSKRRSPMRLRSWSFQRLIPSQAQAASTFFWGQGLVNAAKRQRQNPPKVPEISEPAPAQDIQHPPERLPNWKDKSSKSQDLCLGFPRHFRCQTHPNQALLRHGEGGEIRCGSLAASPRVVSIEFIACVAAPSWSPFCVLFDCDFLRFWIIWSKVSCEGFIVSSHEGSISPWKLVTYGIMERVDLYTYIYIYTDVTTLTDFGGIHFSDSVLCCGSDVIFAPFLAEIAAHTASIRHCGRSEEWPKALLLLKEFALWLDRSASKEWPKQRPGSCSSFMGYVCKRLKKHRK